MKKYTKQYEYKNQKFNTCVELNFKSERHINGQTWHKVTTTLEESGKVFIEETLPHTLQGRIEWNYLQATRYIDGVNKTNSADVKILIELGFE